jgi:hypothetical protein
MRCSCALRISLLSSGDRSRIGDLFRLSCTNAMMIRMVTATPTPAPITATMMEVRGTVAAVEDPLGASAAPPPAPGGGGRESEGISGPNCGDGKSKLKHKEELIMMILLLMDIGTGHVCAENKKLLK